VFEKFRNQGVFKAFMASLMAESINLGYKRMLVEQVHNPILSDYLITFGFKLQQYNTYAFEFVEAEATA
jgi:hypothetical protein